jgi:hypothetical protein
MSGARARAGTAKNNPWASWKRIVDAAADARPVKPRELLTNLEVLAIVEG